MTVLANVLCRSTRFQFRQSTPITQIALVQKSPIMSTTDKIAGLKEILALDPKNAFARYGIAMELANRGEVDAALKEFDLLIEQNPDYTAAYFMSAQTLAKAGRNARRGGEAEGGNRLRCAEPATAMLSARCRGCWTSWIDRPSGSSAAEYANRRYFFVHDE